MWLNNTKKMDDLPYTINTKPAIVVDLEDTLVHVTSLPTNNMETDNYFIIKFKKRKYYVQMRPHLQYFLEKLEKLYDIYIFTASTKDYANQIINHILPNVKNSSRFFRDSCSNICGYFVKDLSLIKCPIQKILLIDDFAGSAMKNPKNLIKIKPWNGEKDDNVLQNLSSVLENIALDSDLRESFINTLKTENYEGINTF